MWFDEWMNLPEGGRGKPLMLVAKDEYVSGANLVSAEPQPNPAVADPALRGVHVQPQGRARALALHRR